MSNDLRPCNRLQIEEDQLIRELEALKEFVRLNLQPKSLLSMKIHNLMDEFKQQLAIISKRNELDTPITTSDFTSSLQQDFAEPANNNRRAYAGSERLLESLSRFSISPKRPFEAFSLAVHDALLAIGFQSMAEECNQIPGFAPSLRGMQHSASRL